MTNDKPTRKFGESVDAALRGRPSAAQARERESLAARIDAQLRAGRGDELLPAGPGPDDPPPEPPPPRRVPLPSAGAVSDYVPARPGAEVVSLAIRRARRPGRYGSSPWTGPDGAA